MNPERGRVAGSMTFVATLKQINRTKCQIEMTHYFR